MRIYYRGPAGTYEFPVTEDGSKAILFRQASPGLKPEQVAEEVTDDQAMTLLFRNGHNFLALDPADQERIVGARRAKRLQVQNPDNPSGTPETPADSLNQVIQTSLQANTPAVEKVDETRPKR